MLLTWWCFIDLRFWIRAPARAEPLRSIPAVRDTQIPPGIGTFHTRRSPTWGANTILPVKGQGLGATTNDIIG
jgi:hypothetical protein